MRESFVLLVLLLSASPVLAQSPPARTPTPVIVPEAPQRQLAPLLLSLDAMTLFRADPAYDAFAGGTATSPQMTVSMIVWEPAAHFSLAPELSLRHESTSTPLFQAATSTLAHDVVAGGAIFRWEPFRWFQPFVRASLGAEHHTATIGTLTGEGWELLGTVGAGIELDVSLGGGLTRRRGPTDAALGIVIEGGAVLGSQTVVRVSSPSDRAELPGDTIARTAIRVGALDATAGYLRLAFVARF